MSARPPLALVTGSHRRLGARIAMTLARAGYELAIHGRHDAEPHPFLAQCLAETGVHWAGFVADFLEPGAVEAMFPAIIERFGHAPDLLVNSASLFGQDVLGTVTAGDLASHQTVNVTAAVLLTQAFAAADRDGAHAPAIVNILDQRLEQLHGDQLAYTLSKASLAAFTQIAARELAPTIRVNAVAPGLTLASDDYGQEQLESLAGLMPLAHLPEPDDVADAVLFLARARSVTGDVLHVDAGAHMKSYGRDFVNLDGG